MKKNKLLLAILFSASLYTASWADPYSNAYGRQAVMSPGGIPSSLSLNRMTPSGAVLNQPAQSYGQPAPNGVYLGGQQAMQPMQSQPMSMNMNAMPGSMANMSSYAAPQSSQYYSGSNFPQQQQMGFQPMQPATNNYYSPQTYTAPNIGAFAVPDNSYLVTRPQYGVPAQLVQRNSSSSPMQGLPYRAQPNMPLNPNSGMNMTNNIPPQTNNQVMNILSGSNGQNASVMSILGAGQNQSNTAVQSNSQNPAGTWVKKVFTRPASNKVSGW